MAKPNARDTWSDVQLLRAAGVKRDEEAFAEVVRIHGSSLKSQALRSVAPAYADDLVQRTLIRAWRGARSYQGGSVRAWLGTIMAREATSPSLRPSGIAFEHLLENHFDTVEDVDDIARRIDANAVDEALSNLDPMDAVVVRMRVLDEASWKAIGHDTGIGSAYRVRLRYERAMRQLRRALADEATGN